MNSTQQSPEAEHSESIRILLIEDSESDAFLITELLAQLEEFDHHIVLVETLELARKSLRNAPFDIVLLDLSLPDSAGLSTLCTIQDSTDTAIVILTGSQDHSLRKQAIRKGAQDYLPKDSINPEVLRRTIEYAIERQRLLTNLSRSTAQLEQSQIRTRRMFDQSFDGIAIVNSAGKFLFLNPAAKGIFGRSQELLLGKPFGNEISESTIEIPKSDEHKDSIVEIRKRAVDWESEEAWLVVLRDVTDRIELEEKLRQAQKMEAIGRLAGGVAHDFNNQLTAIMGFTELALRASDSPRVRNHLEHVRTSTEKSAALTAQLLTFGRKQVLQPEPLCLNSLLLDIDKLLRRVIRADIEIVIQLGKELDLIYVDPTQIDQVIMNLVINAGDALPNGGQIRISTANITLNEEDIATHERLKPGSYTALEVADTGIGMDKRTLSQVFEPFFTTKDVGKGTGLGLATVYGIVSQSEGEISVSSELGEGTTFRVLFPITKKPTDNPLSKSTKKTSLKMPETILLVEDENEVLDMLKIVLELEGSKVLCAENGTEALEIIREIDTPVDLLLTDLIMPKMGGKELAEIIRLEFPDTVTIFMSGYTRETIVQNGVLEDGAILVQKPISPISLVRRIKEVFSESK